MNQIEEITFIRWKLSAFEMKIAKHLRKKGIKVSTITIYELKDEFKEFSDESIFWLKQNEKTKNAFKKIINFIRFLLKLFQKKYFVLIGVTSTGNWFPALIFFLLKRKSKKRIYFPYDIAFFRYKDYSRNPFYVRFCEQFNFNYCDGIIHKGPSDQFSHLPRKFHAVNKPLLQFLPYCDKEKFIEINDEFFQNKLSLIDNETHLVYVGGVYQDDNGYFDDIDNFKKILNQKVHLHIYSQKYDRLINHPAYKKINKSKYFHLHEPVYGKNLQIEISKYDWGLFTFYFNNDFVSKLWAKTSFGNKISNYFEAGLPVIINNEQEFGVHIIETYESGIVIERIEEIKDKIEKASYSSIVKSIDKNRKQFTIQNNIDRMLEFIREV